ncbi:cytochrome c-type heme lyase-like isoform X2 [Agrilus planipennis]|nr:cytochrome c-type heme lyase-like isoform X2 [Agrilus planipennis]XP_018335853.1 cytochrome c-type heme lyase-like isoform X2 [Agrilus planipennis]
MMPNGNQNRSPGQPFPLSTERQLSSIPKAIVKKGETPYWEYPSAQMFWNAMLRKGWRWKQDDLKPADMESIIKIHNMNNERAWQEILTWERALHGKECYNPKLKSFGGKSTDYSPKAMINWLLGSDLPFDRHDWIVDRCGKDVKYVIDYYSSSKDPNKLPYAILDVRLALNR